MLHIGNCDVKFGNLIDLAEQGELDVIVHGCNVHNTMGKGIAKELATRYPQVRKADDATLKGDFNKIGTYSVACCGKFNVINLYTQKWYWSYGQAQADLFEYAGLADGLEALYGEFGPIRYGFPKIGAGLAGGDWERIVEILNKFATKVVENGGSVTIVLLEEMC